MFERPSRPKFPEVRTREVPEDDVPAELVEEGNAFEAEAVAGVEDACTTTKT